MKKYTIEKYACESCQAHDYVNMKTGICKGCELQVKK